MNTDPSTSKTSSVDKPVKSEEKSVSSSSSDSYAELTGLVVGKAEDAFDGPVTVTIQLTGGASTGDLVLSFPNQEAARNVPDLVDDKGQHIPPIPVKIKVMPGEGAPPPGPAKAKAEAKDKDKDKDQAKEAPPPHSSGGTY